MGTALEIQMYYCAAALVPRKFRMKKLHIVQKEMNSSPAGLAVQPEQNDLDVLTKSRARSSAGCNTAVPVV